MRKLKSKVATVLMTAMVMIFSVNSLVFAAESDTAYDVAIKCDYELPENNDSSSEYFRFENPLQRMDSNGNFTFSFKWTMDSDSFKPKTSSIKVYITATSTSDKEFYVYLFKLNPDSDYDTMIKKVTYTADGQSKYYEFKDLDTKSYYYLSFDKPFFSDATITGSGYIDSIQ